MNELGIIGLVLVAVTFLVSYKGFKDPVYFDRHLFRVKDILYRRQYQRLLSSGFLHVGWVHLLLNVATFYCFSGSLEASVGYGNFLLIYFASLLGGNLFSLLLHRHDAQYSAVGASGAISGLVFASIALYPDMGVGLFDFYLPGWLYGLLYVVYSAYGISARRDNIGHDAHLGGGLVGLLVVVALEPALLLTNYLAIGAIVGPTLVFLYLLLKNPAAGALGSFFSAAPGYQSLDDRYHSQQQQQQAHLDALLDKINRKGFDSLSAREKQELKELSRWWK